MLSHVVYVQRMHHFNLRRLITESGKSQAQWARDNDFCLFHLNAVLNGRRRITAKTAIMLEKATNRGAMDWMMDQARIDLAMEGFNGQAEHAS